MTPAFPRVAAGRVLPFAWRALVRQPARSALGIIGVAAVGALLFDMLLLSEGLLVSMRDLLDRTGFDVRVTTTADLPRTSPPLDEARKTAAAIAGLPEVRQAFAIRFADATIEHAGGEPLFATLDGVAGTSRTWTVLEGREAGPGEVVISRSLADAARLRPGGAVLTRLSCDDAPQALPPAKWRVSGIAAFPFELTSEHSMGGLMETLESACGTSGADRADMIIVISNGDAAAAASAVERIRPDLRAATNAEMLGRLEQGGFTYFRQISVVLTTVTIAFALLLITVLLTVSVNQRLGEIAALRALGFSRQRVVADVLCESALLVGIGGLLSLPLGLALARGLDGILKSLPNIPAALHFFVFEPAALVVHALLLAATALLAAAYPMRIVARLPIAATLRNEVIS
jgi:putative ABC transport system permease protein